MKALFLLTVLTVTASQREGKILNPSFWLGIGDGLQQRTGGFFNHMETAMGQLSDVIERRVEDSMPPWLRTPGIRNPGTPGHSPTHRIEDIEAVEGSLGVSSPGVDDGLQVHVKGEVDTSRPDGVLRPPSSFGLAVGGAKPPHSSNIYGGAMDPSTNYHPFNGLFDPFNFNPFRSQQPFFNVFNPGQLRHWWQGENVCVDRQETDEEDPTKHQEETPESGARGMFGFSMEFTSCTESEDKRTCTTKTNARGIAKTVKVTHRCCHGYGKDPLTGCTKVDLRPLLSAVQQVGASDFLSLVKAAGLEELLSKGNYTLFVPTDEAVQEYTNQLEDQEEMSNGVLDDNTEAPENSVRRTDSKVDTKGVVDTEGVVNTKGVVDTKGVVLSHVVAGFKFTGDLHDEDILYSEWNNSSVRVNTYNTLPPSATVNCARLITVNNPATNGVLHTIDRVLAPVTSTIATLISSNPDFTILKQLAEKTGHLTVLQKPGQLTLFAPTDAAFNKMAPAVLASLIEGNSCVESVVANHILPNVICSSAVQGKARTVNLLKNYLTLERTDQDEMLVEGALILKRDIVGTNGVIHVIDTALIPTEATSVLRVLEGLNVTRFLELCRAAGIEQELTSLQNVTIFAPSNGAVDAIPKDTLNELMNNPEKLREVLKYHISTTSLESRDVTNNHIVDTEADIPLRLNLYSNTPLLNGLLNTVAGRNSIRLTAGCSPISVFNSRACGAVVHVVDNFLQIPKQSVLEQLDEDSKFSIFNKILKESGINDTLAQEGPFTVLAPSDHVFHTLPEHELQILLNDSNLKEKIVKRHILLEYVCCSGINPSVFLFMDNKKTLDGNHIHVRRAPNGYIMAGAARIVGCGSPRNNGIVHTVNHLLVDFVPQHGSAMEDQLRNIFEPNLEVFLG